MFTTGEAKVVDQEEFKNWLEKVDLSRLETKEYKEEQEKLRKEFWSNVDSNKKKDTLKLAKINFDYNVSELDLKNELEKLKRESKKITLIMKEI
jgi:hypothetical protein